MALLGVCIWLVSAVLAYLVAEVAVICCDRREWDRSNRVVIAIYCLLFGPISLIIFLEILIFAEGGKEIEHHRTLHHGS